MATWLDGLPAKSAMPPPRVQSTDEKPARRHVLAGEHRAGGQVRRRRRRQVAEHPIAEVPEIGGAGAEIVVVGAW